MLEFRRKLKRMLSASWVYLSVAVILLGSSVQVVTASNEFQSIDTCVDLLPSCELVEVASTTEAQHYEATSTLARVLPANTVTYTIEFQGELEPATDQGQFVYQVAETLADDRGWARAGYAFNRVQSGGQANFSLILIQAELLDTVPGCSSQWSCRSGVNVYINENRWNNATSAWNGAGGSLRDYRHMVVNHEVGHWLGHGHYNCSDSPNNLAPVMQQQSIDLQGCKFNPWPLEFEINAV
jgi:hypothetical protein